MVYQQVAALLTAFVWLAPALVRAEASAKPPDELARIRATLETT